MRTYVDIRYEWDAVAIYLFQDSYEGGKSGIRLYEPSGPNGYPQLTGEFLPEGQRILEQKPFCTLPLEVVDEIVAKRKNVRLDETITEALNDTRQTRDRLLTLVEKAWPPHAG